MCRAVGVRRGRRQRVIRWGNVSYAFFGDGGTEVLWSWTVGDESGEGDGDRREPQPIVEQPAFKPTTERGIGLGTPVAELRATLGRALSVNADGRGARGGGVTFSLANGVITGIQGRLGFC